MGNKERRTGSGGGEGGGSSHLVAVGVTLAGVLVLGPLVVHELQDNKQTLQKR